MNTRRPRFDDDSDPSDPMFPSELIEGCKLPQLPVTRFTRANSGASQTAPYPFSNPAPFWYQLLAGWKVVGWARNDDLDPAVRRTSAGGPYIAYLYLDPDGFEVWFHHGDHQYVFIQS